MGKIPKVKLLKLKRYNIALKNLFIENNCV
jgi:hypothetical protein